MAQETSRFSPTSQCLRRVATKSTHVWDSPVMYEG